jgi:GTP-binding protein
MATRVLQANFLTTATQAKGYPTAPNPEVAFVGRSNVGKSSMINTLANRLKLVRVSNTPGRTQTLNFFDLVVEHRGKKRSLRLCDLPGYGFAKAPKSERAAWKRMIAEYLGNRRDLKVVVAIIDAEVGPTADDAEMLDTLVGLKPKILVAVTKIDRLNKARRIPRVLEIQRQLELPDGAVIGFSSTEKLGLDAIWDMVLASLSGERDTGAQ